MKNLLLASMAIFMVGVCHAQTPLITKESVTSFYSHAPLEDIEAINKQTTAAINLDKKEIVVKMLIKHFTFENALMQEHFNENYMESEDYPSSVFKGTFSSAQPITLNTKGKFPVSVNGVITIHGVEKEIDCEGEIEVGDGSLIALTKFKVKPKDFGIKIPKLVVKNIAEEIEVTSTLTFKI